MKIVAEWKNFKKTLKGYGCSKIFNKGLDTIDPKHPFYKYKDSSLKEYFTLLQQNNGQRTTKKPIFKSVSGWDLYKKHSFLSLDKSYEFYKKLIEDKDVLEIFGDEFIPISWDRSKALDQFFVVSNITGQVYLLWCAIVDPFNPVDWQLARFLKAKNIAQFLRQQSKLY